MYKPGWGLYPDRCLLEASQSAPTIATREGTMRGGMVMCNGGQGEGYKYMYIAYVCHTLMLSPEGIFLAFPVGTAIRTCTCTCSNAE